MPKNISREIAAIQGSLRKNPNNWGDLVNTNDVGEPPEYLTEDVKEVWEELVSNALPGSLTASDRIILEVTCTLLWRFRATLGGALKSAEVSLLMRNLQRLGLTPTDRSRVAAPSPTKNTEFEEF
jgi:phage terminase small subunit